MFADGWKRYIRIISAELGAGYSEKLDLLAKHLEMCDQAKQELRNKGYGHTGLDILETVKLVPAIGMDFGSKPDKTAYAFRAGKELDMVIVYDGEDACTKCLGWRRVDDGDGVSWKYWAELKSPEDLAVRLGVVKPIICPKCGGSGQEPQKT